MNSAKNKVKYLLAAAKHGTSYRSCTYAGVMWISCKTQKLDAYVLSKGMRIMIRKMASKDATEMMRPQKNRLFFIQV